MLYILTLNEARLELGIQDSQDDALLTQHMEGLQGRFDEHLGRTLLRGASVTELHDGGGLFLYLARFPVEAIASVHVSDDQEWDANSLLESTDYRLSAARGKLGYGIEGATPWPGGLQNIRVVYAGGYVAAGTDAEEDQHALPEAIRRAFRLQLGFEWRNRLTMGQQSVSAQGANVSLAPAKLLPDVEAALQSYRRI